MTVHDIGPDWVELRYTSAGHQHKHLLPCAISGTATAGVEPEFVARTGPAILAGTAVAAIVAKLKTFFSSTSTYDSFYVFHKPSPSDPPVFIWSAALGIAGTNAGATTVANEAVFSFKTPQPGGLKVYLMETAFGNDLKAPQPATTGSDQRNFTDYMVGSTSWVIGRNGSPPLIPLFLTTKENDHLRRRYLL